MGSPRALIVLAAIAFPAIARADPCAVAPAEIAVRDADLGAPRAPCIERRIHLRLRALALIDVPSFYGTLDAGAVLGVRWPIGGIEGSAELRLIDWRFAQNASLAASELGVGPLAVGALLPLGRGVASSVRVALPFTDSNLSIAAASTELALHAATRPVRGLTLHGTLALVSWVAAPPTGLDGRAALGVSGGVGVSPLCWLDLLAGAEAQSGWHGGALDHLVARTGLRIHLRRHAIELFALLPILGDERTDAVITLGWSMAR